MVFLGILQNSQEIKLQVEAATLLKKGLWHRYSFPVNFPKFLRTHFLTKHLRWLLLYYGAIF